VLYPCRPFSVSPGLHQASWIISGDPSFISHENVAWRSFQAMMEKRQQLSQHCDSHSVLIDGELVCDPMKVYLPQIKFLGEDPCDNVTMKHHSVRHLVL
jgi:hypothetical protein